MQTQTSGFVLVNLAPGFKNRRAVHALPQGRTVVGRSKSKCDFVIDNDTVSREHAEIQVSGLKAYVRDLGSSNGTFLDKVRITSRQILLSGSTVTFGTASFQLRPADSPEPYMDSDEETNPLSKANLKEVKVGRDTAEINPYFLTPAPQRVLDLLLDGKKKGLYIAQILGIAQQTVHTHIRHIYRVYGVHTRAELIAKVNALRHKGQNGQS
jgi:pSer/pThr/pTyr-binding forkhead associated (FHA) protein